jgi:hypothetical protein
MHMIIKYTRYPIPRCGDMQETFENPSKMAGDSHESSSHFLHYGLFNCDEMLKKIILT